MTGRKQFAMKNYNDMTFARPSLKVFDEMSGKIERFFNQFKELLDAQDSGYLTVATINGVEGVILAAYGNSELI